MAKEYKLTRIRLAELEQELHYLKTTREKEVAEHLKEARSFGDLSENSEYDEAKNEQGKLYSRIAEIENIPANAVLNVGSKVRVRDIETGEEEEYTVVGSQEADPLNGRVSEDSPFGSALIGKMAGDAFSFEAPIGVLTYEVLSIE